MNRSGLVMPYSNAFWDLSSGTPSEAYQSCFLASSDGTFSEGCDAYSQCPPTLTLRLFTARWSIPL